MAVFSTLFPSFLQRIPIISRSTGRTFWGAQCAAGAQAIPRGRVDGAAALGAQQPLRQLPAFGLGVRSRRCGWIAGAGLRLTWTQRGSEEHGDDHWNCSPTIRNRCLGQGRHCKSANRDFEVDVWISSGCFFWGGEWGPLGDRKPGPGRFLVSRISELLNLLELLQVSEPMALAGLQAKGNLSLVWG